MKSSHCCFHTGSTLKGTYTLLTASMDTALCLPLSGTTPPDPQLTKWFMWNESPGLCISPSFIRSVPRQGVTEGHLTSVMGGKPHLHRPSEQKTNCGPLCKYGQVFSMERGKNCSFWRVQHSCFLLCSLCLFQSRTSSSNGGDIRQGTSVMSGVLALCLSKASGMKEVLFTTVGNFSLSQRGERKGFVWGSREWTQQCHQSEACGSGPITQFPWTLVRKNT